MKIAGIIAEYNPFHNGHAYHIERTREHATHIIAIMSGHFTQRGDLACFSKWTRAQAALKNGVDLVIELPAAYACSSAERFAFGGVSLLNSLGCVDMLSFGSEEGELPPLENCARQCVELHKTEKMRGLLKQGLPYPKARQAALGDAGRVLEHPNNTLGVEYIKAALELNAGFSLFTVKRKGSGHDEAFVQDGIASASFLRSSDEWEGFVPENTLALYRDAVSREGALFSRLEQPLLYLFRIYSREQWRRLPDVTEGLENRLYEAARSTASVSEFLQKVKTKRYTMSRLRRILCAMMMGLHKDDYLEPPCYGRVLGANRRGFEILSKAKQTAKIPFSTDFAKLAALFPKQACTDCKSTDIYFLATPEPLCAGQDFFQKPVILE